MPDLLKEYYECRKRWLIAKEKRDEILMGLWERVGKSLREKLEAMGVKLDGRKD